MKRFGILFLFVTMGAFVLQAQILNDAGKAFRLSKESQKPVLLIFSGSDWCAPCIRFQKTILSNEQFQQYAFDHFILLNADFPQRKKLDELLKFQNEHLAEKYNPKGQFPHFLLLHPDESVSTTLFYKNQNVDEFISQLSTYFSE